MEKSRFKIFTVTGFDVFHAGSKYSVYGSYIGVPINFDYKKPEDVPTSEVKLNGEAVDWTLSAKEKFKEALVLTEDEQDFALMREILQTRTFQLPVQCMLPAIATFGAYALSHTINNKLKLFQRPRSMRMMQYFLVSTFMFGNYCFMKDLTACKYDANVDKQLAEMGEKWIKAGIGFYDKILKKNLALRELTGDNSKYSSTGNVNFLVRQKTMPLTERKKFFEKRLKELKDAADEFDTN